MVSEQKNVNMATLVDPAAQEHLFPREPNYLVVEHFDRLLLFCCQRKALDITLRTDEVVYCDIDGRKTPVTERLLTTQELSDIVKHIYGSDATEMIFSGRDIDTDYRIKSKKNVFRFRVNITAFGDAGVEIVLQVLSSESPFLSDAQGKANSSMQEDINTAMFQERIDRFAELPKETQSKLNVLARAHGYDGFLGMARLFWEKNIYPYLAKALYGPQAGFPELLQSIRDWVKGLRRGGRAEPPMNSEVDNMSVSMLQDFFSLLEELGPEDGERALECISGTEILSQ